MRIVPLKAHFDKMHLQPERLYFYLHFALDIILGDRCDKKTKTQKTFIQVKPHLLVVEFSNNVTF